MPSTTAQPARARGPSQPRPPQDQPSGIVRTLTTQLADLKRRRHEETALRQVLEQAHGENLVLRRRRLASHAPETGEPS